MATSDTAVNKRHDIFVYSERNNLKMSCLSQTSIMYALQRLGRIMSHYPSVQKGTLRLTSIATFEKQTVRSGHQMGGVHPGNVPPLTKKPTVDRVPDESFTLDETNPDDAFEGTHAYNMHMPNYETENFSFDSDIGILQEREDEIKHFEIITFRILIYIM